MYQPLADELRPTTLDDVYGQEEILGEGRMLRRMIESGRVPNLIFYGPSGTGKTTVANIIAAATQRTLYKLNATTASTADIREIVSQLDTFMAPNGVLLYLDEIQSFNKKQQQSLLEHIENGKITLIASTTENPYFYIFNAILSRCTVFEFKPITPAAAEKAVRRAVRYMAEKEQLEVTAEPGALEHIASSCGGDIRKALNAVEALFLVAKTGDTSLHIRLEDAKAVTQRSAMRYDREGDNHYDCLSALMKSIRGSDPDAAIHYLARFLEVGDLPACCRRLLCSAAEDIGLAYPQAIPIVKACVDSALQLGHAGGAPAAGRRRPPAGDGPEVQFRLAGHRRRAGGRPARKNRRHPARAAERPRRQRRAGARAGLSLPAQFPEPLGPAAVPAGPVKGHGLLSLRRQQGRAGRPALLGRDQRRQRWKFRSVIFS